MINRESIVKRHIESMSYNNLKASLEKIILNHEPWWPSGLERHTINGVILVALEVEGSNPASSVLFERSKLSKNSN